jgi:hypothetical protein
MAERVVTRRFASDPWLVAELMADLSNRYFEAGDLKAQRAMLARARAVAMESKGYNALALANCLRSNNYWIEDILDSARIAVDEAKTALASTTPDRDVQAICLEAEGKVRTRNVGLLYVMLTHGAGGPFALPALAGRLGAIPDSKDPAAVRAYAEEVGGLLFDGLFAAPS